MSGYTGFERLRRNRYFDDGDATATSKRLEEVVPWSWGWTDELAKGLSQISQQIAFCWVWDASATTWRKIVDASLSAFTQFALFPSTTQNADLVYLGNREKFERFTVGQPTVPQAYTGNGTAWEYYATAGWSPLTLTSDGTDLTAGDGLRTMQQAGEVVFAAPADWEECEINNVNGYWIRIVPVAANISTVGVLVEVPSTEFVSSADYVDSGMVRTNVAIDADGVTTSCDVTGLGEFEITITTSTGREVQRVFRFHDAAGGAVPGDYA